MNNPDGQNSQSDKKPLNKARSCNNATPTLLRVKNEPTKRKSFNENEAVKSLDLALGRLKKSKLVTGESTPCSASGGAGTPLRRSVPSEMVFLETASSHMSPTSIYSGINVNNSSMMSMNFSHYELMRNLSRSNSTLGGAFSETTSTTFPNMADASVRNERLEKYFRSAEMWSRKNHEGPGAGPGHGPAHGPGAGHNVHFQIPDK